MGLRSLGSEIVINIVNIVIWVIIGFFIGKIIKKNRENYIKGKKQGHWIIWILGIVGAIFVGGLGYLYYSFNSFWYTIFFIFLGASIGVLIGKLIKEIVKRNKYGKR